jgi:NADP-dependent 3-hydroxy acid dehydrogenase YdfG
MSTATTAYSIQREPELLGQTVVVIGGSAGIGLETARRARAEGASVILTGRDPERLRRVAGELEVFSTAAFDATDATSLAVSIMHVALRCDGKGIVILSCPLRGLS